jgi:biopolymer transport protein ExbD
MLLRKQDEDQSAAIELTPLVDMVFLLLIFFLVATTFHQTEREMQIVLPEASSAGPISLALKELVVNIDEEGAIYVGGQRISAEDLEAIVTQAVATNPDQKVTIRADQRTSYADVVRVLDIAKAAGIQEPYLDTVPTS